MERKKASDFDPDLLDLFDRYVHGGLSRRGFLDRARRFAVGGVTAAALLEALSPNYALGQQVAPDDGRVEAKYLEYDSPQGYGTVKGYRGRPAGSSGKPPVSSSSTRIGGSTPISKTWHAAPPWPGTWRSRPMGSRPSEATPAHLQGHEPRLSQRHDAAI